MGTIFEAGDHLVLSVPVVRAIENDPWSTVTFALANRQWVTIPQDSKEIVKVLKGPADALIEEGRRRELVHEASVRPATDGLTTVVFKLESGLSEFELSNDEFARFAARAVSEASRHATPEGTSLQAGAALGVAAVSVEEHASDPASIQLALQTGGLKLTFELEANALLHAVKLYLDRRKSARSSIAPAEPEPAAEAVNGHPLQATG